MQSGKSKIEINEKEACVLIYVNPKIYPLDVIYSSAYVFLDRAYILLDGDPKKEIIVELRFKEEAEKKCEGKELEKLGGEFFNELLNYSFYKKQSEKSASIRRIILQRALLTNLQREDEQEEIEEEYNSKYVKDPEGIAIPWDEKYNKNKKGKKKR